MPNRCSNLPSFAGVGRRKGKSCRFAGAITHPSGIPARSVVTERFVPCFPRSTGDFPAAGRFDDAPVDGAATEVETDDLVVGLQTDLIQLVEDPSLDPLITAPADGGGRTGGIGDLVLGSAEHRDLSSLSNTIRLAMRGLWHPSG